MRRPVPLLLLLLLGPSSAFSPPPPGAPARSPPSPARLAAAAAPAAADSDAGGDSDAGSTTTPGRPRVCVLGGGFGGINAALGLAGLPWPEDGRPVITLVDRKERFVFLPLLYELCVGAASLEEVAPTYRSLLSDAGGAVEFERAEVVGVDVESCVVHTEAVPSSGRAERGTVPYDALVVATGARLDLAPVPGAEDLALPFYTVEQCLELRRRFAVLDLARASDEEKVEVVVIGGGYSGVELALNALERLGGSDRCRVTLVHRGPHVLQYATEHNRRTGTDRLASAGVEVMTDTSVVEIEPAPGGDGTNANGENWRRCAVRVSDKGGEISSLPADLLLWTAGATSSNDRRGVLNSVLPRDGRGHIVTGKLLRVRDTDNVFALGDCSRARKVPYAATAQAAMQQAPVAAWNVYATLMNRRAREKKKGGAASEGELKLLPFSYLDLGEMMTLGNEDATISSLGGLVELSGPGASVLRRLVYAVRMPTARQGVTAVLESTGRRLREASSGVPGRKGRRGGKVIQWK